MHLTYSIYEGPWICGGKEGAARTPLFHLARNTRQFINQVSISQVPLSAGRQITTLIMAPMRSKEHPIAFRCFALGEA